MPGRLKPVSGEATTTGACGIRIRAGRIRDLMADRKPVTLTLTEEAITLTFNLKDSLGVSRSAVVEMALREFAERRKPPAAPPVTIAQEG